MAAKPRGRPFKKGEGGRPLGAKGKRKEVEGFAFDEGGIERAKRIALGTEKGWGRNRTIQAVMLQYLLDRELGKAKSTTDLHLDDKRKSPKTTAELIDALKKDSAPDLPAGHDRGS